MCLRAAPMDDPPESNILSMGIQFHKSGLIFLLQMMPFVLYLGTRITELSMDIFSVSKEAAHTH